MYVLKEWIAEYFSSLIDRLKQTAEPGCIPRAAPRQLQLVWNTAGETRFAARVYAGRPFAMPALVFATRLHDAPPGSGDAGEIEQLPGGHAEAPKVESPPGTLGTVACAIASLDDNRSSSKGRERLIYCSQAMVQKWWSTRPAPGGRDRLQRHRSPASPVRRATTANSGSAHGER